MSDVLATCRDVISSSSQTLRMDLHAQYTDAALIIQAIVPLAGVIYLTSSSQ